MTQSRANHRKGTMVSNSRHSDSGPKGQWKSLVSRRDVICCLDAGIPADTVADLCGFRLERRDPRQTKKIRPARDVRVKAQPLQLSVTTPVFQSFSCHVATRSGVRDEGFEPTKDTGTLVVPFSEEELKVQFGPPAIDPLMPLSRLWPYLHSVLGHRRPGHRLDVRRATRIAALGGPMLRLPRYTTIRWTPCARLIIDQSLPVGFIDEDINVVVKELERLRGRSGLRIDLVAGNDIATLDATRVPTLVLSDLGQLRRSSSLVGAWLAFGLRLRREGVTPVALVPCPRDRWLPRLTSVWHCACWDRHARIPPLGKGLEPIIAPQAGEEAAQRMHRVLNLVSPALVVEPALLRAIRCTLSEGRADVGSEFDVRTSASTEVAGGDLALVSKVRRTYAEGFAGIKSRSLKQKVMELILTHHAGYGPWLRWREVLNLHELGAPVSERDHHEAEEGQKRLNATMLRDIEVPAIAERFGLFQARRWEIAHLSTKARGDRQVAWGWALTCRFYGRKEFEIPEGMNADDVQEAMRMALPDPGCVTKWQVRREHRGNGVHVLQIRPWAMRTPETVTGFYSGLPLAVLFTRRGHLTVIVDRGGMWARHFLFLTPGRMHELPLSQYDTVTLQGDCGHVEIRELFRPPWATRFGWDEYGLFADFEINGVVFGLRWIPPGTFMMGSPEDEPGRYDHEGPQHRVTVGTGFWLGSTPVTQGQYAAVAGQRPSEFKHAGDRAPVERVKWENCREFCRTLKKKVDDLDDNLAFRLPTEAQWEYACRAGTTTALYTGALTIKGENNGPELDTIAWYGGNSGVDYEGGQDSSGWPKKQKEHSHAGTHPVAEKDPNPWGLYDMLGNVWEWCEDTWHNNYERAPSDGEAWLDKQGEYRVSRGGSWDGYARYCRCACRSGWLPGERDDDVGFRLVLAPRSIEQG